MSAKLCVSNGFSSNGLRTYRVRGSSPGPAASPDALTMTNRRAPTAAIASVMLRALSSPDGRGRTALAAADGGDDGVAALDGGPEGVGVHDVGADDVERCSGSVPQVGRESCRVTDDRGDVVVAGERLTYHLCTGAAARAEDRESHGFSWVSERSLTTRVRLASTHLSSPRE